MSNTFVGYPSYDDLQRNLAGAEAQISIVKHLAKGWEELAEDRGALLHKAQTLLEEVGKQHETAHKKLGVEERHSEKRRVEIMRMQDKLRARRQQVKHLLSVIDKLQQQPHVQGNPSKVGCKNTALMEHVNHGQKGSWTYRYDDRDDTIYLQVDAPAMTTAYLEELLSDLQLFKLKVSSLRKSLKVDIADVSVLTNALKAKGYNDEAIRELIQTIKEVK